MSAQLDLRDLALDRPKTEQPRQARKRSLWMRYGLPIGIVFGFLTLLGWAARDRFLPRKPVTIVPVLVTRAEVQQVGTPLFQAPGWIEPRPTAIHVPALTAGVIEELLVVEGQEVKAHEPVARLIPVDAEIALKEAQAALALRDAEVQSAQAELKGAKLRVENPVNLEAALAEAESQWAKTETELAKIPFLIDSAQARRDFARENYNGKRQAGQVIPPRTLQKAKSDLTAAEAEWKELQQRKPLLQEEIAALKRKVQSLKTERMLLINESQAHEDAKAKLLAAQARRNQAQLVIDKAELNLRRTVVQSPIAGRVMQLIAYPGTRVMGLNSASEKGLSSVVTLYDPKRLQVRADVRLEDLPLVRSGQPVEIETASSKEPLRGVVLSSTSSANIQKNTLEVKVALLNPPATVTPEMLVTATFLAPPQPKSDQEESQDPQRLLVPRSLVESSLDSPAVWIVDASGVARKRSVTLGKAGTKTLVEVTRGLTNTDKLISSGREGLSDGDRVQITGEDRNLGRDGSGSESR